MGSPKNRKKLERMTLDDFISAKRKKENDALRVEEIEIPSTGKAILCRRPSDADMCDVIDEVQQDDSTQNLVDVYAEVIYNSCEDLHKAEVREALDIQGNPVDVVFAIMDLNDILKVGDAVCQMNSLYARGADEVKNA